MTLFLSGDVMLGRGVDQILPHPGLPELHEPYVQDARDYVGLAESLNGRIPAPVDPAWPWGDLLRVLERAAPDVRILNLETAVTRSSAFAPGKGIHYRMNPANLGCLAAVRPDVCALANNHVLDFGRDGLLETLATLHGAGITTTGAGRDEAQAWQPAALPIGSGRVLVLALATPSSGVPAAWAATTGPGVAWLPLLDRDAADRVAERLAALRRPGDVTVVSVHWGSNWGYAVGRDQARFAHRLIDLGAADVVHGHSSHHPRPLEIYRDRLILYGCGDLVNDYEGIAGHAEHRPELRPAYLIGLDGETGAVTGARIVVLRARRMRLERAPERDVDWLADLFAQLSAGCRVAVEDGEVILTPSR